MLDTDFIKSLSTEHQIDYLLGPLEVYCVWVEKNGGKGGERMYAFSSLEGAVGFTRRLEEALEHGQSLRCSVYKTLMDVETDAEFEQWLVQH